MAISATQVRELRELTGAGMMDCKKALEEASGDIEAAHDYLRKKGVATAQKKAGRATNEGAVAIATTPDRKAAAMVQLGCETDFVARNDQFRQLLHRLAEQVLERGDDEVYAQPFLGGEGTVEQAISEEVGRLGENMRLLDAKRLQVNGHGIIGGYVHSNGRIGVLVALQSEPAVDAAALEALARDLAMHIAASDVSALTADDVDPAVLDREKEILVAQAKESGKPDHIVDKMVEGRLKKFVAEITLVDQPFVKDPDRTVGQVLADAGKEMGARISPVRFAKFQF